MKKILLGTLIFLCVSLVHAAQPMMPSELLGVWTENNPDGLARCDHYDEPDNDGVPNLLIFEKNKIRDTAEYGEDALFYVKKINKIKNKEWNFNVLAHDYPYDGKKVNLSFLVKIKSNKLQWITKFDRKNSVTSVYVKCQKDKKNG